MADYQAAVMQLASRQFPTDPVMRRLEGFINIQRFTCAWGLIPGSVTDENSPFNECSHAYLAATRALLLHLRGMQGNRTAVSTLVAAIESDMLQNGASLVLCRYSDEPFNTGDVINPSIGIVPLDPVNVARLGLAMITLGCVMVLAIRWRTRPESDPRLRRHLPAA